MARRSPVPIEPQWYKDAIFYELNLGSFQDSDSDGVGDLRGLIDRLDYLQDLGATAVWLAPLFPSPLRDDGYDIADYSDVHPGHGTLKDVRALVREAHLRGLRVVMELVLSHTSDQHPWFQRARRARPGSSAREFYVWSDSAERYAEAPVLLKGQQTSNWTWDPVARSYYFHRFHAFEPDLNFAHRPLRDALFAVVELWLGLGVDGLVLGGAPYLYKRDGTPCEHLPEVYALLGELRRHVDGRFADRLIAIGASLWPADALPYLGDGDRCHMVPYGPLLARLLHALRAEDRFPVQELLAQTPALPEACQWALALRGDDGLTSDLITDERRDYLYRLHAHDLRARRELAVRRRVAPLVNHDRRQIELLNGLLFSLPGAPVVYYGDEIGMGDSQHLGGRQGARTPMQWSADCNAGFSRAAAGSLPLPVSAQPEHPYQAVNVEVQQHDAGSLLWWMKRLIALRRRHPAFGRGAIELLCPDNHRVLTFLRTTKDEVLLIACNLSRFGQWVDLDLRAHAGRIPVELLGGAELPPIRETPYRLTLGPHGLFWFRLDPPREPGRRATAPPPPTLALSWGAARAALLVGGPADPDLLRALAVHLQAQGFFGGSGEPLRSLAVAEVAEVPVGPEGALLVLLEVEHAGGAYGRYLLPLSLADAARATELRARAPQAIIADVRDPGRLDAPAGALYDPVGEPGFDWALLEIISDRRRLPGRWGEVVGHSSRFLSQLISDGAKLVPRPLPGDPDKTMIGFGSRLGLRLVRRVWRGAHPDLDIGRFLTERGFPHVPRTAGAIEYHEHEGEPTPLAILQEQVAHARDGWSYTLDELRGFLERVLAVRSDAPPVARAGAALLRQTLESPPARLAVHMIGYLEWARLLGQRTAELHLVLVSAAADPAFAPEPLTTTYLRGEYQALRDLLDRVVQSARRSPSPEGSVRRVIDLADHIEGRLRRLSDSKISALRGRHHGDYHLGQVLHTGKDIMIQGFEGDPARPVSERRAKRSPLRDVAGMMRSFHRAAAAALQGVALRPADVTVARPWVDGFWVWAGVAFLRSYLQRAGGAAFVPQRREELAIVLESFLLERALHDLGHAIDHRPGWVSDAAQGLLDLLEEP